MKKVYSAAIAMTAGGLLALTALAQNLAPEEILDARTKVETAVALAEIAEAEGDGEALLVAARMLANAGKVAKRDADASAERSFYSVGDLAAAAKAMGADVAKADEVAASESTDRGYCYWEFKCGTFECGWLYLCE